MRIRCKVLSIFFCCLCVIANAQKPLNVLFKKGDRVCFVGNSITHNGEFHHNILQYYVTRFPNMPVSFFNAGIKGDVTGGALQRIQADVLIHKPTHVVIMIGMNDVQRQLYTNTITQNVDTLAKRKAALDLYSKNLDSIVRTFIKKGVKVILQKPSAYDQTSKIKVANNLGFNDALFECGTVMQKLANKYALQTVDYGTIMTNITKQIQDKNPNATLTVNDRVHPNSTGHMVMAYQFLKSTNSPTLVSKVVIDVKKLDPTISNSASNIKKAIYTNKVLTASILENALPFPIADNQEQAITLVPFMQDLNNQLLQIKNLEKGKYQLLIDSIVIDHFSNDTLEQGINLAIYKQSPQYKQAVQVRKQLEALGEVEATIRAIAFVEYMHLQNFSQKNDIVATKKHLDSLYNARFKGQAYYANTFEKYISYKQSVKKLYKQADSIRAIAYKIAQPIAHQFILKKVEEPSVTALIEASQSGAMPLLFDVQSKYLVTQVDEFLSDKEFFIRDGLPNFFNKIQQKNPSITIGFLGGSITKAEDQYRNQTLAFIQSLNPTAKLKGINAGVSGTGTELGSCRVKEQILRYNPDLVFVEFAVNGGSNQAMEGIVRQIRKHNPQIDICFIYTISGEQYKQYAKNEIPGKIQGFEKVATHYKIPSIHLGLYPSMLEAQGKLVWKNTGDIEGKIVFSKDGTHPAKAGGDLYAQAIARAFNIFKTKSISQKHELVNSLYSDNWEDGGMYAPSEVANFSKGWETVNPVNFSHLKAFAPWFSTIQKTTEVNASFSFKFKGTAFGFFDIGGPEVGQVLVEIDGKCAELIRKAGNVNNKITNETKIKCLVNRFNSNCNNRYRGQFEMYEVPDGEHEVKISLSPLQSNKLAILHEQDLSDIQQNPEKYNQQIFYLGKILLKGTFLSK